MLADSVRCVAAGQQPRKGYLQLLFLLYVLCSETIDLQQPRSNLIQSGRIDTPAGPQHARATERKEPSFETTAEDIKGEADGKHARDRYILLQDRLEALKEVAVKEMKKEIFTNSNTPACLKEIRQLQIVTGFCVIGVCALHVTEKLYQQRS